MACKECGQEVPVVKQTTREKIEALRAPNTLGSGAKGLIEKIVDILSELEARPAVTFLSSPNPYVLPTPPLPYVAPLPPLPWQETPTPVPTGPYVPVRPYIGDPLPRWGTTVCEGACSSTLRNENPLADTAASRVDS